MSSASARSAGTISFLARRQLWERRGLTALAIGGVALGVFVLVVIKGIMSGFHEKFVSTVLSISPQVVITNDRLNAREPAARALFGGALALQLRHAPSEHRRAGLKNADALVRAVKQRVGVSAAAASLAGNVLLESRLKSRAADLRGVLPAEQERVTGIERFVSAGRFRDLMLDPSGIVLGKGVAEDLSVGVGDKLRVLARQSGESKTLRVVGIYDSGIPSIDRSRAFATLHTAQTALGRPHEVSRVELLLNDPQTAPALARSLEAELGYDAESWQEANANFLSMFAMQNMMITFVIAALLAVGGFGILAVQLMLVLQRRREIAILRSMGFLRRDVVSIFLLQGLTISTIGAVLGNSLGKLAVHYLAQVPMHIEGVVKSEYLLVVDAPRNYAYGMVFPLVVGLLAALLPAWQAARVEPVSVLRGAAA